MKVKRNLLAIILSGAWFLCGIHVHAQYKTNVVITNMNNASVTNKAQNAASKLLSELTHAFFEKRNPGLGGMDITADASRDLLKMWEMSSFRCIETNLIEVAVTTSSGFQIRNVPVYMSMATEKEGNYEEIVINFTSEGVINSVQMSVYQVGILRSGVYSVTDMRRRQIILDFVEDFRTAYGRKDLTYLNQVFSNDAIIITGRVVKPPVQKSDRPIVMPQKVELVKQNKVEYMAKLAEVFKANSYIYLDFSEIKITQSEKHPEIYGVELKQGWHADRYSDEGYLFLMIDFKNELEPMIHVRTWTPDSMFDLSAFPIGGPTS